MKTFVLLFSWIYTSPVDEVYIHGQLQYIFNRWWSIYSFFASTICCDRKSHPLQRNGLLRFQSFQEIEEVGFVRMSLQIRSSSQSAWASKSIQRNVPFTQVLP